MKKRIVAALMIACMLGASLTGCGGAANDVTDGDTNIEVDADSTADNGTAGVVSNGNKVVSYDFMSSILGYADGSNGMNYSYGQSQYGLAEDHVFEFEVSDAAGKNYGDSFRVYRTEEAAQNAIDEFLTSGTVTSLGSYVTSSKYEDGKIKVAPHSGMVIDDEGIHNVDGSNWGVFNRLFLVQYIDLETGEDLAEPIVTIFSIEHEMDAPIVRQGLNENKHYQLVWDAIPGATSYGIYEIQDGFFNYQGSTTSTSFDITEFNDEKNLLSFMDWADLDFNGADYGMNYNIASSIEDGEKYVVIAFNSTEHSGISNMVDPADIGATVPNSCVSETPEYVIASAMEVPMYCDVQMADGSIKKMLIEYHGAAIYDNDDYIYIATVFYNTNLHCGFRLVGITLDELVSHKDEIKANMEAEAERVGGAETTEIYISEVPTSNEEENNNEIEEYFQTENTDPEGGNTVEPDSDVNTDPEGGNTVEPGSDVNTDPEGGNTVEPETNTEGVYAEGPVGYYQQTLDKIDAVFNKYGIDTNDVQDILYAESKMGAYIAYAIMARMEYIPVPVEIFPEAANVDNIVDAFCIAYRQNPTSGMFGGLDYSYDAQTLIVSYRDDTDLRLTQTKEELAKAHELAATLVNSSMTEAEMVYTINNYFCDNAAYDFDSTSTDSNVANIPQAYIDAHTPYGILCKNYGVCESYSEAFALTARCAGIDVLMQVGVLIGAGGHEWNKVEIDGKYYVLDVTNNDQEVGYNTLLLISDEQATILAPESGCYGVDASAYDESLDYYRYIGRVASTKEEAVRMLEEDYANSNSASVRLDWKVTDDEVIEIARQVYADGYPVNVYGCMNNVIGIGK